jgi:hypothetical protein
MTAAEVAFPRLTVKAMAVAALSTAQAEASPPYQRRLGGFGHRLLLWTRDRLRCLIGHALAHRSRDQVTGKALKQFHFWWSYQGSNLGPADYESATSLINKRPLVFRYQGLRPGNIPSCSDRCTGIDPNRVLPFLR